MPADELSWEMDDSQTGARVTARASPLFAVRLTKRMTKVDPRLIAIARGEIEPDAPRPTVVMPAVRGAAAHAAPPDDPFGGLIPVDDDGVEIQVDWLDGAAEPEPFSIKPRR
jgi:hypothetical protein